MKFLSVAGLLSTASATVLLSLLPDEGLKIGETYDVEYLLDQPYVSPHPQLPTRYPQDPQ